MLFKRSFRSAEGSPSRVIELPRPAAGRHEHRAGEEPELCDRRDPSPLVEHLVASPSDPGSDRMIDSRRRPHSQAGIGIERRDPRLPGGVIAVGDLEDRPHAPPHPRWVGRPAVWPQAIGPFAKRRSANTSARRPRISSIRSISRSVVSPSRTASRAAATATGYQSLWPNSPAVRPLAALKPKLVPFESHSRTAEALAATAFSTAHGRGSPKQMPPCEPAAGDAESASRRSTVGALASWAIAETPQPTASR